MVYATSFSPLLIGIVIVTWVVGTAEGLTLPAFSPLLIGIVIVTDTIAEVIAYFDAFQSPFNRDSNCNVIHDSHSFSPLLIGIVIVTQRRNETCSKCAYFQSPFNRDSNCNNCCFIYINVFQFFQSPFNRDSNCNYNQCYQFCG